MHIYRLSQGHKSWGGEWGKFNRVLLEQLPRMHLQNKTTQTTFISLVEYWRFIVYIII